MAIVATAIDPSVIADFALPGLSNLSAPVWRANGALYVLCRVELTIPAPGTDHAAVYKSEDEGASWTIQDAANMPVFCSLLNSFLEVPVIYVLAGPRNDESDEPLRIFLFDCSSDTWSTIAIDGPDAHFPSFIMHQVAVPDHEVFTVVYGKFGGNDLYAALCSDGVWTELGDLRPFTSASLDQSEVYGCADIDDRSHVIFQNTGKTEFWHVAIESDGTISSTALPTVDFICGCAIVNPEDSIVIVCSEGDTTKVISGTPNESPSFTLSDTIDEVKTDFGGRIYFDTSLSPRRLVMVYGDYDSESFFNSTSTLDLTGLSGWSEPVKIYDINVNITPVDCDPSGGTFPTGLFSDNGTYDVVSNYFNTSQSTMCMYYLGSFTLVSRTVHNTFE